jgi:carbon monoxide dehydrogenase subunit G
VNFENSFTVPVPAADVWQAMMDLERVAPCMPGAEVTERSGDDAFKVQVRVKLGPMSMMYRGQAEITGRDDEARRAAMRVRARETRGQGSANATVQITLGEEEAGTRATMITDLKLSGRAAAMGRGVITDVSNALVTEFAANLARMLSEGSGDGSGGAVQAPGPPASGAASAEPSPPSAGEGPSASAEPSAPAPDEGPSASTERSPPVPGEGPPASTEPSPPAPDEGPPASAERSPPAPGEGPSASAEPSPPAPDEGPSASTDALDAGQLARSVVISRLREPRTLLSAAGLLALMGLAVGFRLGRRAGRR